MLSAQAAMVLLQVSDQTQGQAGLARMSTPFVASAAVPGGLT